MPSAFCGSSATGPDDQAWERAHAHYLRQFSRFSDIQDEQPLALWELEALCHPV